MATKSGKTIAARNQPSYAGVNLFSPDPVATSTGSNSTAKYTTAAGGGEIAGAIAAAQTAQDQANLANNTRYNQGLQVLGNSGNTAAQQLAGGETGAQGYISKAIQNSNQYGNTAKTQLGQQLTDNQGKTAQNLVSRGLNNTTILDTMQGLNQRTYNNGMEQVNEDTANRMSGLNLQQAQTASQFAQAKAAQTSQSGNSIAGFIAARNDVAPSISEYAGLAQAAAAKSVTPMQGTVVNAPASYTGTGVSTPTYSPKSTTSGGSSSGSNYFNNAASGGNGSGSGSGGYQGGTGDSVNSGGSQSSIPSSATSAASSSATTPTIASVTNTPSPAMGGPTPSGGAATEQPGTASITPSKGSNAAMDIYSYYKVPFASILSDQQYRDYAAYVNGKKGQ